MSAEEKAPKTLYLQSSHLQIHWPDGTQTAHALKKDVTRIGRGEEGNDLVLPASMASISRRHLEIRRVDDTYEVVDPGSSNGVFLNRQRVRNPMQLRNGDRVSIGLSENGEEVILEFVAGSDQLLKAAMTATGQLPTRKSGQLVQPAGNRPFWEVRWPNAEISYVTVEGASMLVGRSVEAQLHIPLPFVSQKHFEIREKSGQFLLRDLNSTNGTYVDNQRVAPNTDVLLNDSRVVRVGDEDLGLSIGFTFHDPTAGQRLDGYRAEGATIIQTAQTITMGRAKDCDIVLDSVDVSRHHAVIQQVDGQAWLQDLHSSNGTYVNGKAVERAAIREGDLIQVGSFLLVYAQGKLTPYQSNGMRVDVLGLSKDVRTRKGRRRILEDVDMTVLPREFVAIVGGSGAGKSTLLNALIGYRPGQGQVRLNGQDFYADYERFRSQLGFVPQSDILHTTLTVERALDYAARLRLPGPLSKEERRGRIDAVLETVSMNTEVIRKTRIGDLSGGQRKRVSIAAELLADPKLIYLDEATSGLDPGLEKKLMYTLRRMADEGRTVVLITHATSNIVQADHVAFLSQGRLIYFGPSNEALEFFGVEDFSDIYALIEGLSGARYDAVEKVLKRGDLRSR